MTILKGSDNNLYNGGAMVSVDENFQALDSYIMLYPNPSHGIMTLEVKGKAGFDNAKVTVTDLAGISLMRYEWHGETTRLDLSGLAPGVYFVEIDVSGSIQVRKVVIQ